MITEEMIQAALSASPAGVVKPLEWEKVVGDVEVAGSYKIDRMRPWLSGKPKKFFVQVALGFGLKTIASGLASIEAAKAAAFADYSARIMSAIEPAGVGVETKTERVMSDPCVQKLEDSEPFFVLLGRDRHASEALCTWIFHRTLSEGRTDKVKAAEKTLDAFRDYQNCPECVGVPDSKLEIAQAISTGHCEDLKRYPQALEAHQREAAQRLVDFLLCQEMIHFEQKKIDALRFEMTAKLAVVSPDRVTTLEQRVAAATAPAIAEALERAVSGVKNWNSYNDGEYIRRADAVRMIREARKP